MSHRENYQSFHVPKKGVIGRRSNMVTMVTHILCTVVLTLPWTCYSFAWKRRLSPLPRMRHVSQGHIKHNPRHRRFCRYNKYHSLLQLGGLQLRGGDDDDSSDYKNDDNAANDTTEATMTKLIPRVEEPPVWAPPGKPKRALIMMDIFSEYHGLYLAYRARMVYGVATIIVFSDYMNGYFQTTMPPDDEELDGLLAMTMPMTREETESWYSSLPTAIEIIGIHCESDSGLEASERFAELLGSARLRHCNTDGINPARRNKYLMNQVVSQAGLPVVRQRLCKTVEEALSFAKQELGMDDDSDREGSPKASNGDQKSQPKVVVKPIRGVASDDVYLCATLDLVRTSFDKIHGSTIFGAPRDKHDEVLLQEFAVGQEYAIDIVSKNGEHKVAAIWIYDKRPANGAPFVYYATKLYDGDDATIISDYAKKCLDSLGVEWGISHTEVIIGQENDNEGNKRVPRLVEVNCRQHNMDFIPLVMTCLGYNVFDMLLAAHLEGTSNPVDFPPGNEAERIKWDLLPDLPTNLRMNGAMIHIVNYKRGILSKLNREALMEIQSLQSVLDMEVYEPFLQLGNEIFPTIDIRSDAGWVQLVNDDQDTFQNDYDRIIELMPSLFEVEY